MTTTILITGANRGVGRGLAEAFLARPNHIVIGGVRDLSSPTAKSLQAVAPASGTRLVLVKIDSAKESDAAQAMATLKKEGITSLDVVVANAGIGNLVSKVVDIKLADLREYMDVNAYGVLALLSATAPLLKKAADAKGQAKFVLISTQACSIGNLEANKPFMLGAYGASKIVANYLVRRAHFEEEWLTAVLLEPGFVQTDMGNAGAQRFGMEKAIVPLKDSIHGLVKKIDTSTREADSGKFFNFDGSEMQL